MCFGGGDEDELAAGSARNREIDKMIRSDEKRMNREVKLLLLGTSYPYCYFLRPIGLTYRIAGAGESGKSTVLKQMKLIYAQGFSRTERDEWRCIIFGNINNAFKVIMDAMDELEISLDNPDNEVSQTLC